MQLLDGKALARQIEIELSQQIQSLKLTLGRPPGLAVIMVGDNPASLAYVRGKERACQRIGVLSFGHRLSAATSQSHVQDLIHQLNHDDRVDGILLQLPLPQGLDAVQLLQQIDPSKDVDGLHPVNLGRLMRGEPGLRSCTPAGVMRLLAAYNIDPAGQQAVVIGRSILVGKPMALMLLEANATVTIAHSHTPNLETLTRSAHIIVAAAGRPAMISREMVKDGAVVIDVGINRISTSEGKTHLVGDVDFEAVQTVAGYLTPVPGGVGPMTVAMLLQNTIKSYCRRVQTDS